MTYGHFSFVLCSSIGTFWHTLTISRLSKKIYRFVKMKHGIDRTIAIVVGVHWHKPFSVFYWFVLRWYDVIHGLLQVLVSKLHSYNCELWLVRYFCKGFVSRIVKLEQDFIQIVIRMGLVVFVFLGEFLYMRINHMSEVHPYRWYKSYFMLWNPVGLFHLTYLSIPIALALHMWLLWIIPVKVSLCLSIMLHLRVSICNCKV